MPEPLNLNPQPDPPRFWPTVRILLGATRKRSAGRRHRTQQLLNQRSGKTNATDWGAFGFAMSALLMALINGMAGFVAYEAVTAGQRAQVEVQGKIVVSRTFRNAVTNTLKIRNGLNSLGQLHTYVPGATPLVDLGNYTIDYAGEARSIAREDGGDKAVIEQKLRAEVATNGAANLITERKAVPGLKSLPTSGPLPNLLGSLALFWWVIMLTFQGEGLELDLQRRRHPLWEWLFSHPIPPGAVFLAEMLSPLAANPIYWSGALFTGILYGMVYGPALGALAALLVGVPVTIACACLGKALENAAVLRISPRSRGAIVGIMSWLGYASMMSFLLGAYIISKVVHTLAKPLSIVAKIPSPWLRLYLGGLPNGHFSFTAGILTAGTAAILLLAASVWFSVWASQRGLAGNFASDNKPSRARKPGAPSMSDALSAHEWESKSRFGRDPLYRKEYLWFIRDRSAIVQTILIPLTIASVQAFNLRGILAHAQNAWNYLCGVAIFFGTFFLWVLGPKSLASEGSALWIALTWPRGLEALLKAKAWLWALISSGIVALILLYAAWLFPHDLWKIALVALGWYFFSRSMAEKAVTLVTIASESGEVQKVPAGRRWAAQLGMLTFAIGIVTEQWHIAVIGIVYSFITAAAMWENFRARLPYLYDPWSEVLPQPPTLMNAMIAISCLVELGAVLTGIIAGALSAAGGTTFLPVAQAIAYALSAAFIAIVTSNYLSNRDITPASIWYRKPALETDGHDTLESLSSHPTFSHSSLSTLNLSSTSAPILPFAPYVPDAELPNPTFRDKINAYRESLRTLVTTLGLTDTQGLAALAIGTASGITLALLARGYLKLIAYIPAAADQIHKSQQQFNSIPYLHASYFAMAVFIAPFAEEYLFRGLLFRSLDREWGGWRAILGSAAFFAIYHPPLSWLPVFCLGAANAILFKKSNRLMPCVLLHMAYNAIVLH